MENDWEQSLSHSQHQFAVISFLFFNTQVYILLYLGIICIHAHYINISIDVSFLCLAYFYSSLFISSLPPFLLLLHLLAFAYLIKMCLWDCSIHLHILLDTIYTYFWVSMHTHTPLCGSFGRVLFLKKKHDYTNILFPFFFFYYQILQKNERLLKVTAVMLLCFLFLPWCVYHDLVFSFLTLNNAMVDLG